MTSLLQPVGVWHEIEIQARGDTSCLSMDSIFSLACYVWTFYVFCPSPAVNKTVVHIAFKCIAWSSCLCLVHSRAARKPLVATILSILIGIIWNACFTLDRSADAPSRTYANLLTIPTCQTLDELRDKLDQSLFHSAKYNPDRVRTDHYALVLSPWATRHPTGHGPSVSATALPIQRGSHVYWMKLLHALIYSFHKKFDCVWSQNARLHFLEQELFSLRFRYV